MSYVDKLKQAASGLVEEVIGSKVNQKNYEKIQNGMTLEEVKNILGEPTNSSSAGIGPLSAATAEWKSKEGAMISLQFVNNKVKMRTFKG